MSDTIEFSPSRADREFHSPWLCGPLSSGPGTWDEGGLPSDVARRPLMIEPYGIPASRAARSLWMLEEPGVPYENVPVHFVRMGSR